MQITLQSGENLSAFPGESQEQRPFFPQLSTVGIIKNDPVRFQKHG